MPLNAAIPLPCSHCQVLLLVMPAAAAAASSCVMITLIARDRSTHAPGSWRHRGGALACRRCRGSCSRAPPLLAPHVTLGPALPCSHSPRKGTGARTCETEDASSSSGAPAASQRRSSSPSGGARVRDERGLLLHQWQALRAAARARRDHAAHLPARCVRRSPPRLILLIVGLRAKSVSAPRQPQPQTRQTRQTARGRRHGDAGQPPGPLASASGRLLRAAIARFVAARRGGTGLGSQRAMGSDAQQGSMRSRTRRAWGVNDDVRARDGAPLRWRGAHHEPHRTKVDCSLSQGEFERARSCVLVRACVPRAENGLTGTKLGCGEVRGRNTSPPAVPDDAAKVFELS